MHIKITGGIIHPKGDLIKGTIHRVGTHPDLKLAKELINRGRAHEVSEEEIKAEQEAAKKAEAETKKAEAETKKKAESSKEK